MRLLLAALVTTLMVGGCELADLSGTFCNADGACGEGFSCVRGRCVPGIAGDDAAVKLPFNLDGGTPPLADGGLRRDAGLPGPDAAASLDAASDAAGPNLDAATPLDASTDLDASTGDAGAAPDAT